MGVEETMRTGVIKHSTCRQLIKYGSGQVGSTSGASGVRSWWRIAVWQRAPFHVLHHCVLPGGTARYLYYNQTRNNSSQTTAGNVVFGCPVENLSAKLVESTCQIASLLNSVCKPNPVRSDQQPAARIKHFRVVRTQLHDLGIGTVPYWYGVRLRYGAAVAVPYCHLAAQVRYGYGTIGYSRPLPVPAKPVPLPATAPAKPVSSPACACASREVHHAPMRTKPTHPAWLSARAGPAPSGRHKRNRWAAAGGAGGGNTAEVVHGGRRSRRACGRTAAAVHGGRCGRRRRAGSGPYTVPYPYTAVPYPYRSRTRLSGDWYGTATVRLAPYQHRKSTAVAVYGTVPIPSYILQIAKGGASFARS
ncbi:hypothetical protein GGX14DRAFT_398620 [Mycena pura]|uniref:Uncharacterized protein n=1 Tax=Mycena pura TaxID=153505 RepID=A0AAD6V9Y0_9AGAR|nr:hypothetical protein GGX14DRAFT_398620 [Mycena pura]